MVIINSNSEEKIKKEYKELAEKFIKKHFGSPVVRLPFHLGYISKIKLGEILTSKMNEENIKFMDIHNLPCNLNDSFRIQLLKVGELEGIKFVLFFRLFSQRLLLFNIKKEDPEPRSIFV